MYLTKLTLSALALATLSATNVWAQVSNDGTCGNGKTCPEGSCCSWWGYCGFSEAHCGLTCVSQCPDGRNGTELGPGKSRSIDGHCDANTVCPPGTCCSKWGWCGNTELHCGAGCQFQCDGGSGGGGGGGGDGGSSSSGSESASESATGGDEDDDDGGAGGGGGGGSESGGESPTDSGSEEPSEPTDSGSEEPSEPSSEGESGSPSGEESPSEPSGEESPSEPTGGESSAETGNTESPAVPTDGQSETRYDYTVDITSTIVVTGIQTVTA